MFDKSRRHTGRIVKPSNRDIIEFGNRSQIYEVASDPTKGFGTTKVPGFLFSKKDVVGSGSEGTSWAIWNEASKTGWGDSANTLLLFMENTSAGGNETGQGAELAGADLVFTQAGTLAGATGTPPKRVFDGADDYGTVTATMLDTILSNVGDAWTLVWKVNAATTGYRFLMAIAQDAGSAADYYLTVGKDNGAADKMRVTVKDALGEEALNSTAAAPTTGDVYFAVWAVGGGQPLRFGWCITKPTKWSDFGANNRVICASVAGDFSPSGESWNYASNKLFAYYGAGQTWGGGVYYFLASKSCLIDNGS